MKHQPERTCIGCRNTFPKDQVVRIIAGPQGVVIDYREKLPGRAAYVCAKPACIIQALTRDVLSRALKTRLAVVPDRGAVITMIADAAQQRILSLLSMAEKAGKLATGSSAVIDALQKKRVLLLLFAEDLSEGTRGNIAAAAGAGIVRMMTMFHKNELGPLLGREAAGVCAILDKGFADAIWNESERVKNLRNGHQ
ncbi:MAG: DUF448 domain-containing protein [Nitrospirota bacterium]|nr:DUF448 domain-containing protein [Nitrospirota bacterium]